MVKMCHVDGQRTVPIPEALFAALLCAMYLSAGSMADPLETRSYMNSCNRGIPKEVLHQVRMEYPGWVVQSPNMLSNFARKRWEGVPHSACPGTAIGQFGGQEDFAYALLAVRSTKARLILYHRNVGSLGYSSWSSKDLTGSSSNFFIQGMPVDRFFDAAARRRFRAIGRDLVLVVDAGENEYETDVYFWTGKRFASEPVDY
jgi:hypothetical protein